MKWANAVGAIIVLSGSAFADWAVADTLPKLPVDYDVAAKLASLKANEAAYLGRARVVGEFNAVAYRFGLDQTGPLARDYSVKMVWAPDRGRALFAGANHGRPHRLNDVWEFDLGALAWILLYPPDNPRSYSGLGDDPSDVVFEDGILRTKRGGPVVIGHSWWGTSYDSARGLFLFMSAWDTNQRLAIEQLGGDSSTRYLGPPLWTFDPKSRAWEMVKTEEPYPRAPFGGLLEYVPAYEAVVWHANHWQMRATWILSAAENAWVQVTSARNSSEFIHDAPKPEQVAYYDSAQMMIVAQRGGDTFYFRIDRGTWAKVVAKPDHVEAWPNGHDAYTPFCYSPRSKKGVLIDFRTNELWTYEPLARLWNKHEPVGDPIPTGAKRLAYCDAKNDVFVVIDGLDVWAYRPH